MRTLTLLVALLIPGAAAGQASKAQLAQAIESALQGFPARTGFFLKHLKTGDEVAVRADDSFNSQSVIKMPIMVRAFQLAEQGKLGARRARHLRRAESARRHRRLSVRRSGAVADHPRSHPADDHHKRQHRHRPDDDEGRRSRGAERVACASPATRCG